MKKTFFLLAVLFSSISLFAQPEYEPVSWEDVTKHDFQYESQQHPLRLDTLGYSVYYTNDRMILTNINPKAILSYNDYDNKTFEYLHLFRNKQTAMYALFEQYYTFSPKNASRINLYGTPTIYFDKNRNIMAIQIPIYNKVKMPLKDIFKRYVNEDFNILYNNLVLLFDGSAKKEIDTNKICYSFLL